MKRRAARSKQFNRRVSGLVAIVSLAVPTHAFSQQATDLGTVGSSASGSAPAAASVSKAAAVAPTQSSLKATQPQSIIERSFIEASKSPTSDFSSIAVIAPSMSLGISVNGPGLGETKLTMRGLPDGQFNITWDGIPFGDTNGPTHHSTAYFPASVIGRVEVERGPGNASNLGQATFGGSVNLFSRELAKEQGFGTFFSFGTWNTKLAGASFDSGVMGENGDALLGINVQHQTSDGYRTFSNVWANNAMLKFKKAVGDSSLLTANLNFQQSNYYLNDKEKGLTNDQADRLGKNFNLGDNPLKANYYGYNRVEKSTNMTYVALQTDWGKGWATDNKTYYYNYTNNGLTTIATNMETGLGTVKNSAGGNITNQMPGGLKTNEYDVWGNIAKLTKETSTGLARVGMWGEVANTNRTYYDLNLLGNTITPNYDQAAVPGVLGPNNNVLYNQKSGWHQYQPFAEYEWQVNPDLKVTPGFKYMHTRLSMDALVNTTGRTNVNFDKTFAAKLPYLTANYTIAPGLSTYAQYAQGMLVPDIGSYQSTQGSLTNIDPQKSTNYQLGLVHQSDRLTIDTDIYYIKFTNKIAQTPGTSSTNATYYNQGGVAYKGVEGQLTYALTDAVSGYVNGSLNRATSYATGLETKDVPNSTSALGLLYRSGGWSATVFYKRVGRTYALDDQGYEIAPYSTTDLNVSYLFKKPGMGFKTLKAQLGIFNLQDKQSVIAVSPTNKTAGAANYGTYAAADTFFWQPPRSMMMSLKADF